MKKRFEGSQLVEHQSQEGQLLRQRRKEIGERVEKKLIIRSRCADVGVQLDEYLTNHADGSFSDFASQVDIADIPQDVLERYQKIVDRYYTRYKASKETYEKFVETVNIQGGQDPEIMGRAFFETFCKGDIQNSTIELSFGEGFLMLQFEDAGDYISFKKTRRASFGMSVGDIKTAPCGEFGYLKSLGTSLAPVPYVALQTGRWYRATSQRTRTHERQHFINADVLDDFNEVAITKNDLYQKGNEDRLGANRMKDEFLCRIRENQAYQEIIESIRESYGYLFQEESDFEEACKEVERICDLLEKTDIFDGEKRRTYLLYHLVDVPFYTIAHRVELLISFEEKKKKDIETVCRSAKDVIRDIEQELTHVYPANKEIDSTLLGHKANKIRRLLDMIEGDDEKTVPRYTYRQEIKRLHDVVQESVLMLSQRKKQVDATARVLTIKHNTLVDRKIVSYILDMFTDTRVITEIYEDVLSGAAIPETLDVELRPSIHSLLPHGSTIKSMRVSHIRPEKSEMDVTLILWNEESNVTEKVVVCVPV